MVIRIEAVNFRETYYNLHKISVNKMKYYGTDHCSAGNCWSNLSMKSAVRELGGFKQLFLGTERPGIGSDARDAIYQT